VSVRASALARAAFVLGIGVTALALGRLPDALSRGVAVAGVAAGLSSTARSWRGNTDAAALAGYRAAVHATLLCLLALAAPLLGPFMTAAVGVAALALVYVAFRRDPNP